MKAEIVIKNNASKIILIPESEFEKTMIEDAEKGQSISDVHFNTETRYGIKENHKIVITVNRKLSETTV